MATKPKGPFVYAGKVNGVLCDATVTWGQAFTPASGYPNTPPDVQTVGDSIFVSSTVGEDGAPLDVSPGVLTLTPTVTRGASSWELDPLVLNIEFVETAQVAYLAVGHIVSNGKNVTVYDESFNVSAYPGTNFITAGKCRFSSSGKWLAFDNGTDINLRVVSTESWSQIYSATNGEVEDLDFSPNEAYLAYVTKNNLYVVNTATWSVVSGFPKTLPGYGTRVRFSPDGSMLAIGHQNGSRLRLYSTSDWSLLSGPSLTGTCFGLAFNPSGTRLACGHISEKLSIYNTSDWTRLYYITVEGNPNGLCYSPDGSKLYAATHLSPYFYAFNTSGMTSIAVPSLTATGFDVSVSHDGLFVAVAYGASPGFKVLDAQTRAFISTPALLGGASGVAFSPLIPVS